MRQLKSDKADKASVDAAVAALLDLKAKYKATAGKDWKPGIKEFIFHKLNFSNLTSIFRSACSTTERILKYKG